MGYEVVIEAMRRASAAAADSAAQAGGIGLGAAVDDVDSAMPGSTSAGAAEKLAGTWRNQLTTWSTDTDGYATDLSTAADHYAASEDAARADFQGIG